MTRLELDDVDIGILAFLTDVPNSSTSDIAKALFKPPYNLSKVDCFIRYRLRRFVEAKIVSQITQKRKRQYTVDLKRVMFGNGVLRLDGIDEVNMGYFIVVKTDFETVAKSVDDYERRIGRRKIFPKERL